MNSLKKPQIKTPLLGGLTVLIGISTNFSGWNSASEKSFLLLLIVIGTIYLALLGFYAKEETNNNKVLELLNNEVSSYEEICISSISIIEETANDLNNIIYNLQKKEEIDLRIWNFDKACKLICMQIFLFLNKATKKKNYLVNYVKIDITGEAESIILNAYANRDRSKPSIFGKKRKFSDENGYYDTVLFNKNESDIVTECDKEVLNKMFKEGKGRDKQKYEQYIGIPVFCNDTKMIGLLQVLSVKDGSLGKNKDELKEFASKYLIPYTKLFLLAYKIEKLILCNSIEVIEEK